MDQSGPEQSELPAAPVALGRRVFEIRCELYGDNGGPLLASKLDLPFHVWASFEQGQSMPGTVLLKFLRLTNVQPSWLLTGQGPKYQPPSPPVEPPLED